MDTDEVCIFFAELPTSQYFNSVKADVIGLFILDFNHGILYSVSYFHTFSKCMHIPGSGLLLNSHIKCFLYAVFTSDGEIKFNIHSLAAGCECIC